MGHGGIQLAASAVVVSDLHWTVGFVHLKGELKHLVAGHGMLPEPRLAC